MPSVGHRLHPGALYRQLGFRELVEILEDQLAFAAGVAGVDHRVDVLAGEQFLQVVVAILRISDRLESEFLRDDRQRFETPEAVLLLVDVLRHLELDDMADGGGDDVFVVLEVVALFRNLAESASQILRDARLLGDDQGFGHEGMPTRPR